MARLKFILIAILFSASTHAQEFIMVNDQYCSSDSLPLQGQLEIFHPNGEVSRVLNFENGYLHQLALFYNENGKLTMSGSYHENKRDGIWLTWDLDGKVTGRAEFDQGQKIGEWFIQGYYSESSYRLYFANDKLLVARMEE
ncbi:MAG: hypothetical protein MK081_06330 [Flavobacteriales bacterium]|nr:hypothetical protein [Flavobacteriales bacterium]